jgi:hypothetical protein
MIKLIQLFVIQVEHVQIGLRITGPFDFSLILLEFSLNSPSSEQFALLPQPTISVYILGLTL